MSANAVAANRMQADVAIVGAGAAGLMTAVWAARSRPGLRVLLLDGARKPGAKILVAGGGRCNVTHQEISEQDYAGGSRNTIRKLLRAFPVEATVKFFEELGVALKEEDTGKLFPVSDSARDVLDAFHAELRRLDVRLLAAHRIGTVEAVVNGFRLTGDWGALDARCVVFATGGKSLPKSGSDGLGIELMAALGHRIVKPLLPALEP